MKRFKSVFLLNLDDFLLYLLLLLLPFIGLHLIMLAVMAIAKPETTVLICGMILAIITAVIGFTASYAHNSLSFSQYVTFGQTRKRAFGLSISLSIVQALCSAGLAIALSALEQRFTLSLCRYFSGQAVSVEINIPVEWWVFVLAALGGVILGVISSAVISRFGRTGAWGLYAVFMAVCLSPQYLPWEKYTITDWLFPLLLICIIAALVWSIYTLLHATIK